MKFGLGGKQFIEFSTDVEGLERVAPVQKSTHFTPQWFKEMKDYIPQQPTPDGSVPGRYGKSEETSKKWSSGTVKRCPAIIDLITEGFIIPMWCDFLLQRDNQILEYDNKNFPYGIEFHNNQQIHNWKLKKGDFREGVKFNNPWRIYTPPGYSVMFIAPYYQFEQRFTVLPGIVETDSYHHINFPTIMHTKKDTIIERGTPFIQVIPFKRDDWNFDVSTMTPEQTKADRSEKLELSTKFKNSYRNITRRLSSK